MACFVSTIYTLYGDTTKCYRFRTETSNVLAKIRKWLNANLVYN